MDYSRSASNWWANRLEHVDRNEKRRFAKKLKEEVELLIIQYGHCKLSTEFGASGIFQNVLKECEIPVDRAPFGVRMDIYPKKIQVCYNGGRKETVFEI